MSKYYNWKDAEELGTAIRQTLIDQLIHINDWDAFTRSSEYKDIVDSCHNTAKAFKRFMGKADTARK